MAHPEQPADEAALLDSIESLYAAALDPSLWPDALRRVAEQIGARAAMLMVRGHKAEPWRIVEAAGVPADFVTACNNRLTGPDPFLPANGVLGDVLTILELDAEHQPPTSVGQSFSGPLGFQLGLLAGVSRETGLALQFWRDDRTSFAPADAQRLKLLWPHVARAMTIRAKTWRAADEPAGSWMARVMDSWHIGVVALSGSGRQVYANRAARQLAAAADGFSLTKDGPLAANIAATRKLRDLLSHLSAGRRQGPECLHLVRPSGAPSYEVALHRVRGADQDGPTVALLIAAPDAPIVCDQTALRRLHGLTDLEASVAECLARAMPTQEIAATLHLSTQTARWYVQQVREKMAAASQGEVTRVLLRGLATVPWPPADASASSDHL